jgi:hypothetical protein
MVSGNEIKLCLKHFCLPIYFIHCTNTAWVRARLCKLQKGCTRLAAQVIKFTSCLSMVGGSLRVLRLLPTQTGRHDIAEILLKVALNTKIKSNQSSHC